MERELRGEKPEIRDSVVKCCLQKAYLDSSDLPESFYNFSKNIVGYADLEPKHMEMCEMIADPHPYTLLLACRDTFKSSLGAAAYSSWLVGRDWFLNEYESKVRILFASEITMLAQRNLEWCKDIMTWRDEYKELCGDHKGKTGWSWQKVVSNERRDPRIGGATLSYAAIDAGRTGFHYDIIISDDIEAERRSATLEQIEAVWRFYLLCFSLLEKQPKKIGVKFLLLGTRWHYDDIYERIEAKNAGEPDETKFRVKYIPDRDTQGHPNFPARLPEPVLENLERKHGPDYYASQYKLKPMAESSRTFQKAWIHYVKPQMMQQKLNVFVTGDIAYTKGNPRNLSSANRPSDYTVIFTVGVDERWNYIFIDWFRERCGVSDAIKELYRQHFTHKAMLCVLQKYDKSNIEHVIEQMGLDLESELEDDIAAGKYDGVELPPKYGAIVPEWVAYPSNQSKEDRIKNLDGLFKGKKIYFLPSMQWMIDEEVLNYPLVRHDDGLDALCNVVKVASPPDKARLGVFDNPLWVKAQQLMNGTFDPEGTKHSWKNL